MSGHYPRPMLLVPCEHVFRMTCLIPKVEGKLKSDSKCPECFTLIKAITFATKTGLKEKNEHQCQSPVGNKSSKSMNSLCWNNDISREMEEVAMCMIKHKLANSTGPNKTFEFKTGGSRVSTLSLGN